MKVREGVGGEERRRHLGTVALLGLVVGVALVAAGCGDQGPSQRRDSARPSRCDIETLAACGANKSCGAGAICLEGCCHAPCASAGECLGAVGCDAFGCVCEDGACLPISCSSDPECPAPLACVGGNCVEAGAAAVHHCALTPRWETLRPGSAIAYRLIAFEEDGSVVEGPVPFTVESSHPARVEVVGTTVRGGEESGEVEMVATAGGATCAATLWNAGEAPADVLRVLVVDGASRLPIEGALVQVEVGGASVSQDTDAAGLAELPLDALGPAPRTISVFHDDFAYLTVVGVESADVRLPLSRHDVAPLVGGFRGVFDSAFFQPSRLSFGLAGASIPGNLLDLEVAELVGPIERVEIDLGGARSADLSAGLVFGLGNTWFKEVYRATAAAGACDDRAASLAGACGFRVAWGLAGGIPLEELPLDAIATEGEVDAGSLLAQLLPSMRRLRSAIVASFPIEPRPRTAGGEPPWGDLRRLDLSASQRLSLRTNVRIPSLPSDAMDGVVALVGAQVPGMGMVPLGLTGALDEGVAGGGAPTGVILDPSTGRRGVLDLRFAPLHGGLEGSDYLVMVLAVDLQGLGGGKGCTLDDRAGCTPISGRITSRASLPWGSDVDLDGGGFLGLADRATFDPASRRLELGGAIAGATLLRLQLESHERKWHVVFPAASGVSVPVPAGIGDRMEAARASVQAMALEGSLGELLSYGKEDLSDFTLRSPRFSTIDLPASAHPATP